MVHTGYATRKLAAVSISTLPPAPAARLTIASADAQLDNNLAVLHRRAGEVLLDTVLRLGWTAPHACRRGGCGLCLVRLHRGQVRHGPHTQRALQQFGGSSEDKALACRAVPTTAVVEVEFLSGHARRVVSIADRGPNEGKEL